MNPYSKQEMANHYCDLMQIPAKKLGLNSKGIAQYFAEYLISYYSSVVATGAARQGFLIQLLERG